MDTILKNIKDLRNEFSVSDCFVDGELSNNGFGETEKVDNIDSIKVVTKLMINYIYYIYKLNHFYFL